MPSAESIQPNTRFFGLFIGRSGSGKSAAAYSFPHSEEEGILEVCDLDGRVRGGLLPWVDRKNFNYTYFPPLPDKGTTFDALNTYFEAMRVMLKTHQTKINTFVLDSITWAANDLLLDALPLTHTKDNSTGRDAGRKLGNMNMAGPSDYSFQSTGILQIIAFLRSLPIQNVIVCAHVVNKWGRKKGTDGKLLDPYGPSEIIGEQLSLTDKLSENIPSSFDHVLRFEREDTGRGLKFYFEGQGELARSAFPLPYERIEITNQDFYKTLMQRVNPK